MLELPAPSSFPSFDMKCNPNLWCTGTTVFSKEMLCPEHMGINVLIQLLKMFEPACKKVEMSWSAMWSIHVGIDESQCVR